LLVRVQLAASVTRRLLEEPAAVVVTAQETMLNELLNLECLESAFHMWAALGKGPSLSERFGGPESIGGSKLSNKDVSIADLVRQLPLC
jgi:hypothetical protein